MEERELPNLNATDLARLLRKEIESGRLCTIQSVVQDEKVSRTKVWSDAKLGKYEIMKISSQYLLVRK